VLQALGQRWLMLPLASLGVGGSLPVTIGLTGAFVAWALLVLLADTCALLALCRLGDRLSMALKGATAVVPLMAMYVLSLSPMFATQLLLFAFTYTALGFAAGLILGRRDRERAAAVLFCIWAFIESLFGVVVGLGLNFAAGSLISDELDVTEPEWGWLATLVWLNWILGFASAALSALTACKLLGRARIQSSESLGVSESPESSLGLELLPASSDDRDISDQVFGSSGGEKSVAELLSLRSPRVIALLVWAVLLFCGTIGFYETQWDPPGSVMGVSDPDGWLSDAPCKGCMCQSASVTCASEGGTCSCTGYVSFGRGSEWSQPKAINDSSISCTSDAFGGVDPMPGVGKYCECQETAAAAAPKLITVRKDIKYGMNTNRRPAFGEDSSDARAAVRNTPIHSTMCHCLIYCNLNRSLYQDWLRTNLRRGELK
jgi:hypothetical protein